MGMAKLGLNGQTRILAGFSALLQSAILNWRMRDESRFGPLARPEKLRPALLQALLPLWHACGAQMSAFPKCLLLAVVSAMKKAWVGDGVAGIYMRAHSPS